MDDLPVDSFSLESKRSTLSSCSFCFSLRERIPSKVTNNSLLHDTEESVYKKGYSCAKERYFHEIVIDIPVTLFSSM